MKDVAQFFKVFADESRLQILWLLLNHEELCVCDLVEALGVSQSKVSRHLATLRHSGLVTDRRDGAWSFYSLCPANNELEGAVVDALRNKLADHPGSVRVLGSLHGWIASQTRDVSCGPCCSPKKQSIKKQSTKKQSTKKQSTKKQSTKKQSKTADRPRKHLAGDKQ